ncbi:hypothetical protein GIB67_007993 [Kingdonia uniflora]|uniref:Methyltransferase PMT27 n=1 Tax=Kingdonia uniflora TaxID=39325 RepID=A0A7J7MMR4_9MAGN|nr:hypothetical protein GIB67_007993 [Kingdonia uniflora]
MALGSKNRSGRRSSTSSGSYASTITMLLFIALSAFGLYILTSSSVRSQESSVTRTTNALSRSSTNTKQRDPPVFDDNPGDLPDDAIKADNNEQHQQPIVEEQPKQDIQISEESNETVEKQEDVATEINMNQEQSQEQTSEVENRENPEQNQQETEAEKRENTQQNESEGETKENTQQETEAESGESAEQEQHDSQVVNVEKAQQDATTEETQPEIQEVTNEETTSTQSDNQESQQSENESGSNQETQTQQDASTNSEGSTGDLILGGTGDQNGIPKESKESKQAWSTQADQSDNQKERRKGDGVESKDVSMYGYSWELCNVTAGADYIPCLDNEKALKIIHNTGHYEHRERHCPEEGPTCLVPMPEGYKQTIEWPQSRDKIWYHNVPHTKLAEVKGHQNWVKVTGEFLTFPGGGTQFIHGALHYIDFIQKSVPNIAWGKRTRVILDVGCGVASFGGYLFERDVLAMSFAPKDEHEAQVQFALERGIPAISAVMGTQRLPFPSRVFDMVHCARCRVPWHIEGGALLLELNRVLRPGGYFVWSATPVYQKLPEDVEIWKAMSALTISMCWELFTIKKDKLNSVGAAIYRKPMTNDCYEQRKHNKPPMCKNDDDANAAWYVPLQACMHRVPVDVAERGAQWPQEWPVRAHTPPYWLNSSQKGIYGRPAPDDFSADYEHWKRVVTKSYMSGLGISWSNVRNVMDMRAVYGGFAAALKDLKVWVMNVVNVDSPDTLPIIYERGLFGIYHDWCESFSTYPRTYDLLHADHLFSKLKKRCKLEPVIAEVDRIVRPGGKFIVRDDASIIGEVENMLKSLHWEIHLAFSKDQDGILSAQKTEWRPVTYSSSS